MPQFGFIYKDVESETFNDSVHNTLCQNKKLQF